MKKQKSETESDESFVEVPSAKKIVEEMNQEESEDDELEDNVIDDDEIEFQGTNEPEIIKDIPVCTFKLHFTSIPIFSLLKFLLIKTNTLK